jgi:hypothetical protein
MKQKINKFLAWSLGSFNFLSLSLLVLFLQNGDEEGAFVCCGGGIILLIIYLAIVILQIVGMWKIFTKAGKPGWAAIVPIYNIIVLLEIVGRPVWWIILFIIPIVNIVVVFMVDMDLAKSFGKETGYAVGLFFLPFIFFPMLGLGDAEYKGPSVSPTTP